MAENEVKTRFLIVSDTHTKTPAPADCPDPTLSPFREPLPEADVLLHAGDLTSGGSQREHAITLDFLRACRAELKIIIAGNHDITLDRAFWEELGKKGISADENLDEIEQMYRDAEKDRIFYMTEAVRTFTLRNGAK
ncbi:hypothetical protein KEM55_005681 [Ascosphaera atra]|nr:hypothetical protein KEM55_005681 [Ascosphaera atra]